MKGNLIFLVNPLSGTRDKKGIQAMVAKVLDEKGIGHEFVHTDPAGNYTTLISRIQQEHIERVVVVGGDGTVSQVANALRALPVSIAIIPTGSGNGLALAAGIPRDPRKALEIALTGTPTRVDGFLVNGHFSCMLTGIGFDAQVAHDFAKRKKRGLWTYVKISAANFFKANPYPFVIRIGGNTIETEAYFISIANSNQFGNQFTIAPKAAMNDGMLDVVVVQKMNKVQVLLSTIYQLKYGDVQERIFKRNGILYFQVERLELNNPSHAPLHIDGDPFETSSTFNVEVVPSAFSLVMP